MIIEATGVVPEGRITPGCLGLWKDSQIAPLKHVAIFGTVLAHGSQLEGYC
jgi:2,4-dienoyl-CoA reductase-like NADH-dependent reductase (Old Yellow Enzyme family)